MPKGNRWDSSYAKAGKAFARYIRSFPAYTERERQIAEAAFLGGFRSGVVSTNKVPAVSAGTPHE